MKLTILICVCAAVASDAAKLPSSFTKCPWTDSDCLTKAIEKGIRQMTQSIKELNLPTMGPITIPALSIGAGSGAVDFTQNYRNLKLSGFDKISVSKAEFDKDTNTLRIVSEVPHFRMDFDYEFKGKVLLMPLSGKGPGKAVLHDNGLVLTLKLEEHTKNGKKYFKVVDHELEMVPKWVEFKLKNLFGGDKTLSDQMHKIMSDNWKELYDEVRPSYEQAFGEVFASVFDNLLAKVPISELMDQ